MIEEQKKKEAEAKSLIKPKFVKPVPASDARPVKSILKKSSTPAPPILASAAITKQVPVIVESSIPSGSKRKASETPEQSAAKKPHQQEEEAPEEDPNALPEGFFDDPKQDAKARNIEYKDPKDEEWEKFQKEINLELDTAQEIVSEEQQESTIERQIEEVDDQLRAWNK